MLFYAVAEKDCIDCFYDFEINTFGDGIGAHNLLPSKKLTEALVRSGEIPYGTVIEVELSFDEEGVLFTYENIWK